MTIPRWSAYILSTAFLAIFSTEGQTCPASDCKGSNSGEGVNRKPGQVVAVHVFLKEQRLTLYLDGVAAFCTPVSTGKKSGWTPIGDFSIIGKAARHRSSTYGKFVTRGGKTLRRDVDSRRSKPPAGARFSGAPMPNFLRMTDNGIGIHAGTLPGYPASKGCIRVERGASEVLFRNCAVGDKVLVRERRGEHKETQAESMDQSDGGRYLDPSGG